MKAGRTNIDVGTRVSIVLISNDPDDKYLEWMTWDITHVFPWVWTWSWIAGFRNIEWKTFNLFKWDIIKIEATWEEISL